MDTLEVKKRVSSTEINLQSFQNECKLMPQRDISVLLHKGPLSVDSVSDISTLQYLEKFRARIGYKKGNEKQNDSQEILSELEIDEEESLQEGELEIDQENLKEDVWYETFTFYYY